MFSLWDFAGPLGNPGINFREPNPKMGHPHAHRR